MNELEVFLRFLQQQGINLDAKRIQAAGITDPATVLKTLIGRSDFNMRDRDAQQIWQRWQAHKLEEQGTYKGTVREQPVSARHSTSTDSQASQQPRIGPYLITRELGRGAMGVVYEGLDAGLNRKVAIKVIQREGLTDEARKLFVTEAQSMARLTHGNVVVIYGAGEQGKMPYIAMQFVEGTTLDDASVYALPAEKKLKLYSDVVSGVAALHAAGIVHRDLKQENVMVATDERAVVMDLGLAASPGEGDKDLIVGTPQFMSPEQANSQPAAPSSDVYTLGRILVRMFCGDPHNPWAGMLHSGQNIKATLIAVLTEDPLPRAREWLTGAGLPEQVIQIVERCLQYDPAKRYQDAGQLHQALKDYFDWQQAERGRQEERRKQELIEKQRLLEEEQKRRKQELRKQQRQLLQEQERRKRQRTIGIVSLAVLALVTLLSIIAFVQSRQAQRAAEQATRAESKAKTEAEERAKAESKAAQEATERLAVEQKAQRISTLMAKAYTEVSLAKWADAKTDLEGVLKEAPDHQEAHRLLAEVMSTIEDPSRFAVYEWLADHATGQQCQDDLLLGLFAFDNYLEQGADVLKSHFSDIDRLAGKLEGRNREIGTCLTLYFQGKVEFADHGKSDRFAQINEEFFKRGRQMIDEDWSSWVQAYMMAVIATQIDPDLALQFILQAGAQNPNFHMVLEYREEVRRMIAHRLANELATSHPQPEEKWNKLARIRAQLTAALQDIERLEVVKPDVPLIKLRHAQTLISLSVLSQGEERGRLLDQAQALMDVCKLHLSDRSFAPYRANYEQSLQQIGMMRNQ